MGVSYIPSRQPADYLKFPKASSTPTQQRLPKLSLMEWNKKCGQMLEEADKKEKSLLIVRLGRTVIRVDDGHDPDNPFCVWFRGRLVGAKDITWVIMQTLFDPDLPRIDSPEEISTIHNEWAENQMIEKFEQAGITATAIMEVRSVGDDDDAALQSDRRVSLDNTAVSNASMNSSLVHADETINSKTGDGVSTSRSTDTTGSRRLTKSKSIRSSIRSTLRGVIFRKSTNSEATAGESSSSGLTCGDQ